MKKVLPIVIAVIAAMAADAETWYWVGGSSNTYGGGAVGPGKGSSRDWRDGYNWVDSQGVRGTLYPDNSKGPGTGDTIIFDSEFVYEGKAVGSEYTHVAEFPNGAVSNIIFRGSYSKGSYGPQAMVLDGGSVRYESFGLGNQSFQSANGSIEFYVAGAYVVNCHFLRVNVLRKTGGGTLKMFDSASPSIVTLRLEEGQLMLDVADNVPPLSKMPANGSIVFAGANVTLDLNGKTALAKPGVGIAETEDAIGHVITSTEGGVLSLSGAQNSTTFSGKLTGAAGVCWNPSDDVTLAFTGDVDTSGMLTVSNGVLDVSAAVLGAGTKFAVGGTGRVALPTGFYTGRIVVNGEQVPDGVYTSDGSAGTMAAWLSGSGCVFVGDGGSVEAVWTSPTAGSLGAAENWSEDALPDLGGGITVLKTTTPSEGAIADVDNVFLKGLALGGGSDFAFTGAKGFWLGNGGIKLTGAAKTLTLSTPVSVQGSQFWDLSNGGNINVKTSLGEVTSGAIVTITNGAVSFYGGTHEPSFVYSEMFGFKDGTTNIFNRKVTMAQSKAATFNSGTAGNLTVFNGGLELCNAASSASDCGMKGAGTVIFTNGILNVHSSKRIGFAGGEYHFYSPNNSFNNGQRGYIHGSAVLYFHVTNAFTSTQANLAGNHGDGGTIDLCGCDQTVGTIQCGRGVSNAAGKKGWKWGEYPGTIRSEGPALLHITGGGYSVNPSTNSSPTVTNFAYFVGMAGISYEGGGNGHWLNQLCSSTGTVQTTNGKLVFSRRVVDGDGCDLGEGSWPNAAAAVAKGKGTLVFEHSNSIGRNTDVRIEDNGKLKLDAGVNQKCHDLYIGGVKQRLGTWGSAESTAKYKSASFEGTGVLNVMGDGAGVTLIFR